MCGCVWEYIYIYIYIYIYWYCSQRDYFVVSQLFIVATYVECLKLGSKLATIYVRFSYVRLCQQANYVSSGIIRRYVVTLVCLHICLSGYQRVQFIRRVLHYASGSREFLHQSAHPAWGRICCHLRKNYLHLLNISKQAWCDMRPVFSGVGRLGFRVFLQHQLT